MDLLLAPVFAWVLCAPKYLAGTMTLGELTQASAAFVILQLAFNWLVDNFQRFSDWRAATNRVATLLLALDQVESGHETPPSAPEDRERALRGQKQAETQARARRCDDDPGHGKDVAGQAI
jgi:vitamin B12/bleomycin/antimicrobial peptide transport system ATP-binding/permease protein